MSQKASVWWPWSTQQQQSTSPPMSSHFSEQFNNAGVEVLPCTHRRKCKGALFFIITAALVRGTPALKKLCLRAGMPLQSWCQWPVWIPQGKQVRRSRTLLSFIPCKFPLEEGGGNHLSFPKLSLKGNTTGKLKKLPSLKGTRPREGKTETLTDPTGTQLCYVKWKQVLPSEPMDCFLSRVNLLSQHFPARLWIQWTLEVINQHSAGQQLRQERFQRHFLSYQSASERHLDALLLLTVLVEAPKVIVFLITPAGSLGL